MRLDHSKDAAALAADEGVRRALHAVSPDRLREYVEQLAFPRHYGEERAANRRARDLLEARLRDFGYATIRQGACDNILATSATPSDAPVVLLGAHYDSVPGSPGADDNASAVAVCLECARLLSARPDPRVLIVLFNREEDGFVGSDAFVDELLAHRSWSIAETHIFEMLGYCSHAPHSQQIPDGLEALPVPSVADFLALVANRRSNAIAGDLLSLASTYLPRTPVVALRTNLGPGQLPGDLLRSDHVPFWLSDLPAVMWTDTSNFRNPHYHEASDLPSTLDYDFMSAVTRLALARILTQEPSIAERRVPSAETGS